MSEKLLFLHFPQSATVRIPLTLFIDRFLKQNTYTISIKTRDKKQRQLELVQIEKEKSKIPKKMIQTIQSTAAYLSNNPHIASKDLSKELVEYSMSKLKQLEDLETQYSVVKRKMSDLYEVSALLKHPCHLFTVILHDKTSLEYAALIKQNENSWIKIKKDSIETLGQEHIEDLFDKEMNCLEDLIYSSFPSNLVDVSDIPSIPDWIVSDNDSLNLL